jgi:hypothetical protein
MFSYLFCTYFLAMAHILFEKRRFKGKIKEKGKKWHTT